MIVLPFIFRPVIAPRILVIKDNVKFHFFGCQFLGQRLVWFSEPPHEKGITYFCFTDKINLRKIK